MIATVLLTLAAQVQPAPVDAPTATTRLDMRIAEAVLIAYEEDTGDLPMDEDVSVLMDGLEIDLEPPYGRRIPSRDAWDHPLRCWLVDGELFVTSDGPDGVPSFDPLLDEETRVVGDDIVLMDGEFLIPSNDTIRNVADLATAIESYGVDFGVYPGPTKGLVPVAQLQAALVPVYIQELPGVDAWGNPIFVFSQPTGYLLVSFGSDGRPDTEYDPGKTGTWPAGDGPLWRTEADVLFVNGRLVQWPAGEDR